MRLFKGGLAFRKWRAAVLAQFEAQSEQMNPVTFLIASYIAANSTTDSGLILDGGLFLDGSPYPQTYYYVAQPLVPGGAVDQAIVDSTTVDYIGASIINAGGAATTSFNQNVTYTYVASGGATSGGSATTSVLHTYTYSASGGATAGGTATVKFSHTISISAIADITIVAQTSASISESSYTSADIPVSTSATGTDVPVVVPEADDTGSISSESLAPYILVDEHFAVAETIFIDAPLINDTKDSQDSGSTQTPAGMAVIRDPNSEYYLVFYQNGIDGLVYRRSIDGGVTWGSELVLSDRTEVYPSAVIDPATGNVHVAYSKHGLPESSPYTGWDIYYRALIWSVDTDDWIVTEEQVVEQASDTDYFTNVSMAADANGYLFAVYGRFVDSEFPKLRTAVSYQPWDLGVSVKKDHYNFPYLSEIRPLARYFDPAGTYFILAEQNGFYRIFSGTNPLAVANVNLILTAQQVFGGNDSYEFDVQFNNDVTIINPSALIVYIGVDGNLHRRFWDPASNILSEYVAINLVNSYYPTVSKNNQNWTVAYFEQVSGNKRKFYLISLEEDAATTLSKVEAANSPLAYNDVYYSLAEDDYGHAWSWAKLPPEMTLFQHNVMIWCEGIGTYAAGTVYTTSGNNVAEHDIIYVGTHKYRFEDDLSGYVGEANVVLVGSDYEDSFQNLVDAINGTGTPGTQYTAATTANADVTAELVIPGVGDSYILVTANNYGVAGNSITFHTQETSVAAQGTLTSNGTNVANNDTVTIGSKTYTFKNTINNAVANQVLVGTSASDSLSHLMHAINAGTGSGTEYSSATSANADASATNPTSTTLLITAITAGNAGNSIAFSEVAATLTANTYAGGNTLGGTTIGSDPSGEFYTDGDLAEGGSEVLGETTAGMERQVYTSNLSIGTFRNTNDVASAAESVYVVFNIPETGEGAETIYFLGDIFTVSDTGTGTETQKYVGINFVQPSSISDTSLYITLGSVSTSANAVESPVVYITVTDSVNASESTLLTVSKFASDSGTGSQSVSPYIQASDSASEIEHFTTEFIIYDTVNGTDYASRSIPFGDTISSAYEIINLVIYETDSVNASESVYVVIDISDSAAASETDYVAVSISDSGAITELGGFAFLVNDTGHISESLEFTRSRATTVRLYMSSGGVPLRVEGPLGAAVTTNPSG